MTWVLILLFSLLLNKCRRFISPENFCSSSLAVSSGKMDFSVTSVQCMSTVWSSDHFARLFTVRLTSTDWYCSADLTVEIQCSSLYLEIWVLPLQKSHIIITNQEYRIKMHPLTSNIFAKVSAVVCVLNVYFTPCYLMWKLKPHTVVLKNV